MKKLYLEWITHNISRLFKPTYRQWVKDLYDPELTAVSEYEVSYAADDDAPLSDELIAESVLDLIYEAGRHSVKFGDYSVTHFVTSEQPGKTYYVTRIVLPIGERG